MTRIITEDDEVVRAYFASGRAIIEGVGAGDTTVEVYQGTQTPRLVAVQVAGATALGTKTTTAALTSTTVGGASNLTLPPIASPITPARSPLTLA